MAEAADRHQEEGGDTSAGLVVMPLRDGQTGVVVDADVQAVSTGLCSVLAVVSGEAVLGLAKGASFLISRCRNSPPGVPPVAPDRSDDEDGAVRGRL